MLRAELRTALGTLALELALEVGPGQVLALVGPSGAGKTSVLRALAGLLRPRTGRVECAREVWLDTAAGVDLAPQARRCAYVFQDQALFPTMTARENVAFALGRLRRGERRRRATALLERVGLEQRADALPGSLSGGERQRVALARAAAMRPAALLLDEPLSALDPRTHAQASRAIAEVVGDLRVPAVLVTHRFSEAADLADRVAVLDAGRVVQEGTPAQLAAGPVSGFVADLAGAIVLHGTARPGSGGLTAVELDGGGTVASTDAAAGPVAVTLLPWDVTLEPADAPPSGSARNRVPVEVVNVTVLGTRARVALRGLGPPVAEVAAASLERLALHRGSRVVAVWKASATRLLARAVEE